MLAQQDLLLAGEADVLLPWLDAAADAAGLSSAAAATTWG
jgi:hypothetical protein